MSAQDLYAQQPASTVPDDVEARLEQLGISLPQPPKPVANYVPAVWTGNLVFLAGAGQPPLMPTIQQPQPPLVCRLPAYETN